MINARQALDTLTAIAVDVQNDIDVKMAGLGTDNVVTRTADGIVCQIKTAKHVPGYMTDKIAEYFSNNGFEAVTITEDVDGSLIKFKVPIVRQQPPTPYQQAPQPQYPHPEPTHGQKYVSVIPS